MSHFAFSAIGRDRPGIVAAITRVFLRHGLNIEDSQMTILRGRFSMVLILGAPAGTDGDAVRGELEAVTGELGMDAWSFAEIGEADEDERAEPTHIVTVYGADHVGIVEAVASELAAAAVNITDLETRLVGDEVGEDLYAMMLEVALPGGMSEADLDAALATVRRDQGVEVTVRELERDEL